MTPPPLGSGPPEADVCRLKGGRPPLGGTPSGYGPRGGGVIPPSMKGCYPPAVGVCPDGSRNRAPLCVPHSGATKEVVG